MERGNWDSRMEKDMRIFHFETDNPDEARRKMSEMMESIIKNMDNMGKGWDMQKKDMGNMKKKDQQKKPSDDQMMKDKFNQVLKEMNKLKTWMLENDKKMTEAKKRYMKLEEWMKDMKTKSGKSENQNKPKNINKKKAVNPSTEQEETKPSGNAWFYKV